MFAVAALLAIYVMVAVLGDTRAWSGSDAGGKVATIRVMAETGSWVPDVGYWAEHADPRGTLHPLVKTTERPSGWIQVTSLPLVYLSVPLWHLGGPAALLAIPMAGAVAAALAARRLSILLGSRTGAAAFWAVGVGSPVGFYAVDVWEHAPALALALWGIVAVVRADEVCAGRSHRWGQVALAGALWGTAAAIRFEMAIYLVALGLAALLAGEVRHRWSARVPELLVGGSMAAAVVIGGWQVERAVLGGAVQTSRVGSQASALGAGLGQRIDDAALTFIGMAPTDSLATTVGYGLPAAVGIALAGVALRDARRIVQYLTIVLLGWITAFRLMLGLGFVPGTLVTNPTAGLASLGHGPWDRTLRRAALLALPMVWLTQWSGDLGPQWGGRYTLFSGVLLVVVAAGAVERSGSWRAPVVLATVVVTLTMSVAGLAWHVARTKSMAAAIEHIHDGLAADTVVLATPPHLGREAGASYGEVRWLRWARPADAALVDRALEAGAVETVRLVQLPEQGSDFTDALGSSWVVELRQRVSVRSLVLEVVDLRRVS